MKTYPKRFSHIGITVPDINKAAKFYSEVMGWYTIMPPSLVKKETDTAIGQMCIDVFGDDWETFEIAHFRTNNRYIIFKEIIHSITPQRHFTADWPALTDFETSLRSLGKCYNRLTRRNLGHVPNGMLK